MPALLVSDEALIVLELIPGDALFVLIPGRKTFKMRSIQVFGLPPELAQGGLAAL